MSALWLTTLITPFIAFAPQIAPPGPRMTSTRSRSSSICCCKSQNTPANSGVYTARPSTSTSILLANTPLNPRAEMACWLEFTAATCSPGTSRRASARLVAPERWMSSCDSTEIAAGESICRASLSVTDVTSRFSSSSMLRSRRSSTSNSSAPQDKGVPEARVMAASRLGR